MFSDHILRFAAYIIHDICRPCKIKVIVLLWRQEQKEGLLWRSM